MQHKLGIILFPAYDWAISPEHPEREERLLYTHMQLLEEGFTDLPGVKEFKPGLASDEDIYRVHIKPPGVEKIAAFAHRVSAGGSLAAGELVMGGGCLKSLALVRPPGHHAMKIVHGGRGFCNINNEAIMVERLRRDYGLKRVAIVDTACHHGDGTQDIYWHDPDTLFISIHQDGVYPGGGSLVEMGSPGAFGSTVNIPLPPETGDEGLMLAAREIIRPILDQWRPDLLVHSAGLGSHFTDSMTSMNMTAAGFGELSALINADVAVLEGGYSIKGGLPYASLAIGMSMAGLPWQGIEEPWLARERLVTSPGNMDSIKKCVEEIHALRATRPDRISSYRKEGKWWVRERVIAYDNHPLEGGSSYLGYMHEKRREEIRICQDCPGLLVMHTLSEVSPPTAYLIHPRNICETCLSASRDLEKRYATEPRVG